MCMDYVGKKFPKLFSRLEVLQNIVRYIALFEGILGFIALSVKLTLMILKFDKSVANQNADDKEAEKEVKREELTHIVVLSVYVLQALFALILFEGARRKFLCMVKAWLFFCFFQLLIPITMILCNLFLWRKRRVKIMLWVLVIQVGIAVFHGIEAIFVLTFHKSADGKKRRSALTSFEYYKNNKDRYGTPVRKHSDASFSVQIDSDHENELELEDCDSKV